MDALWKWMMRANAAAVLYAGLALLALLVSFLVWREMHPAGVESSPPPARPRIAAAAGLGLKDFIETEAGRSAAAPGNPFRNPNPERPPMVRYPPQTPEGTPPTRPPNPPPPPPPPPKRELVRLTYRGIYQTAESDPRALIEDSKRRRSSFYRVGEVLFGMKIHAIEMLEVSLRPTDGSDVTLKLGEAYEFEERPNGY